MSNNNTNGEENRIMDVIKELWDAAVNLRGSIEPADYKRYVLPIIFLRFLSLGYEKRKDELKEKYKNETSENLEMILEDPDEYRSKRVFIIPKEARWEYLMKNDISLWKSLINGFIETPFLNFKNLVNNGPFAKVKPKNNIPIAPLPPALSIKTYDINKTASVNI